jgi:hypothetical protein
MRIYRAVLVNVTLMLTAGAGWNAFIHHRGFWALGFATMFGVLASFGCPRRRPLDDEDFSYDALLHRADHRPRGR